ncbi:MAG: hypothetical protein IJS13_05780 [Paludibacteraceae bacterium]|nr:hypothetical protein [Paludibacteraceae bacterium]
MKANKFMIAALFMGALSFVACNKDNNPKDPDEGKQPADTTVVPVEPSGDELPDLDKPAAGILRIVLEIPEGTECNGIALKGTFGEPNDAGDGTIWSGENTYLGKAGAATPVDGEIYRFAAYEGSKKYYTLDLPVGENPTALEFKVCLIFANDGSWQGQANKAVIHECNWSSVAPAVDGGQFKFAEANPSGQLLYINTGKWLTSECAAPVDYKLTVYTPAFCGEEFDIEVVGSFEGWGSNPVALVKAEDGKYTATIPANEGAEVKVRGVGGWDKEIQFYNAETDEWGGVANAVLPAEDQLDVTLDFRGDNFRWNVCAGAE